MILEHTLFVCSPPQKGGNKMDKIKKVEELIASVVDSYNITNEEEIMICCEDIPSFDEVIEIRKLLKAFGLKHISYNFRNKRLEISISQ